MLRIFYFLLALQCQYWTGKASPLLGEKVRKAHDILDKKLTFVVSISRNNSMNTMKEKYTHICGGTLITRQHVLTAAHCFINRTNYHGIIVKVGSFDLMKSQIYEVKWVSTYGEWVENSIPDEYRGEITHDVAIVKLVQPVSCGIQLPKITNTSDKKLYRMRAKTAGWGMMENNTIPRFLRVAEMNLLDIENCLFVKMEPLLVLKEFFSKIYLCTKADPPTLIGCGDSGGPLFINENEIIGVNVGDCRHKNSDPKDLSVYHNKHLSINYHRRFIDELTEL